MKTRLLFKLFSTFVVFVSTLNFCQAQVPKEFIYWKFNSGGYNNAPLISNNVLYCGSMDSTFYALNINTGKELWRFKGGNYIASTPAIYQNVVCFEAGDKLYGLNAKTGRLLWSFVASDKVPTPGYSTGFHHSSPLIYKGVAYYGDEWGNMNGVDMLSGKLVFQYTVNNDCTRDDGQNIRTKPAIKDDIIYFGDYGTNVYAISLKDRSIKWVHRMYSPLWYGCLVSEVVLHDSSVYIGGYNNRFCPLDIKTGSPRWEFVDENTFLPSKPLFYKDNIIMGTTMNSEKIHCIDAKTGKPVWSMNAKGFFFTNPVIVGDSVLIMNSIDPWRGGVGVLYFVNCNNGRIINQVFLENATESYPLVSGNTLFLGRNDGMYAINFRPYLTDKHSSKISFDQSAEHIIIDKSDSLSRTYPVFNKSNFCDSLTVTYSIEGKDTKDNITFNILNKALVKPSETLNIGFSTPANVLTAGMYYIKFYGYSNRCSKPIFRKCISVLVLDKESINNLPIDFNIKVYPNPFKSKVTFSCNEFLTTNVSLTIYSMQGRVLFNKQFYSETVEWDGRNANGEELKKGMYAYSISIGKCQKKGILIKQ